MIGHSMPSVYDRVMQQLDNAQKMAFSPQDLRKKLKDRGWTLPINPKDPKCKWEDWDKKSIPDITKLWYNDRIVIAPCNTPVLDYYNEVVPKTALEKAIAQYMKPIEEGGSGGLIGWNHWLFPAGQVLGLSRMIEDEDIFMLAYGFRSKTPGSDQIWKDVKRLGFNLGFSIGMDPSSMERHSIGSFSTLESLLINEVSGTEFPANDTSATVGWIPDAKDLNFEGPRKALVDMLVSEKGMTDKIAKAFVIHAPRLNDPVQKNMLLITGYISYIKGIRMVSVFEQGPDSLNRIIVQGLADLVPEIKQYLGILANSGLTEMEAQSKVFEQLEELTMSDLNKEKIEKLTAELDKKEKELSEIKKELEEKSKTLEKDPKEVKSKDPKPDKKDMKEQEDLGDANLEERVATIEEQIALLREQVQELVPAGGNDDDIEEEEDDGKTSEEEDPKSESDPEVDLSKMTDEEILKFVQKRGKHPEELKFVTTTGQEIVPPDQKHIDPLSPYGTTIIEKVDRKKNKEDSDNNVSLMRRLRD